MKKFNLKFNLFLIIFIFSALAIPQTAYAASYSLGTVSVHAVYDNNSQPDPYTPCPNYTAIGCNPYNYTTQTIDQSRCNINDQESCSYLLNGHTNPTTQCSVNNYQQSCDYSKLPNHSTQGAANARIGVICNSSRDFNGSCGSEEVTQNADANGNASFNITVSCPNGSAVGIYYCKANLNGQSSGTTNYATCLFNQHQLFRIDSTSFDLITPVVNIASPGTSNCNVQLGRDTDNNSTGFTADNAKIEMVLYPPANARQRVFVTSKTYAGNLGGLTGADAKCQTAADAAYLCGATPCPAGSWKAWLSDTDTTAAASRINHSTLPYKLIDETLIANNWTDLITRKTDNQEKLYYLTSFINKTELNLNTGPSNIWTNTKTDGLVFSTTNNCNNWTNSNSESLGMFGSNYYTNLIWTESGGGLSCDSKARLYCFEQEWSIPLPACLGTLSLVLNPNSVAGSGPVTPTAFGLSNCFGKTIIFKKDSCNGIQVSTCTSSSGTGCSGSPFTAPATPGNYTYFACTDDGKSASATLTVTASSTGVSAVCGNGQARATGLVSTPLITTGSRFGSTKACVIDPKAAFAPFKIPTFDDLKSLYYTQSKLNKPDATPTGRDEANQGTLRAALNANDVVLFKGNLNFNASLEGSLKTAVVFVEGNLSFNKNFTFGDSNSGLVFVVGGDVNIDKSVTQIDAVIISEGTICTAYDGTSCLDGNTPTPQLTINGSLISLTESAPIKFRRKLGETGALKDSTNPAEIINHQVKYLVILRNLISDTWQKWSEIP